jgi:hypothetical protein
MKHKQCGFGITILKMKKNKKYNEKKEFHKLRVFRIDEETYQALKSIKRVTWNYTFRSLLKTKRHGSLKLQNSREDKDNK